MLKQWMKKNTEDKIVDIVIYVFCAIVLFITVYPFYYILSFPLMKESMRL